MKQSISIPEMYMQFTETDLKKKKTPQSFKQFLCRPLDAVFEVIVSVWLQVYYLFLEGTRDSWTYSIQTSSTKVTVWNQGHQLEPTRAQTSSGAGNINERVPKSKAKPWVKSKKTASVWLHLQTTVYPQIGRRISSMLA